MAAIANSIQARIAELVYPAAETHPDPAERRAAWRERQTAVSAIEAEFASALADEHLHEISEGRRQAVGALVYRQAWEAGHSAGYGEIENLYGEFAETALAIYDLATS
jgi:hypothetical protein